jgi:hypothetical protein
MQSNNALLKSWSNLLHRSTKKGSKKICFVFFLCFLLFSMNFGSLDEFPAII